MEGWFGKHDLTMTILVPEAVLGWPYLNLRLSTEQSGREVPA